MCFQVHPMFKQTESQVSYLLTSSAKGPLRADIIVVSYYINVLSIISGKTLDA